MTELVIVVAIIWILMMWLTVYLGWLWWRAKIIEGQWCATSLRWEMNNYVFYALTSKNIRLDDDTVIAPDYYYIQLTGGSSTSSKNCTKANYTWSDWTYCDELVFGYRVWNNLTGNNDNPLAYKTYTQRTTCRQNQEKIWFYWSGDIKYVKMNKWFSPTSIAERKVFFLQGTWTTESDKYIKGDIIVVLCPDDDCTWGKEVAKRDVDARTQTISFKKCRFYQGEDENKCEAREE